MQAFDHAANPERALGGFFRVLKSGGSIVLYDYDHRDFRAASEDIQQSVKQIDQHAPMLANEPFNTGVLRHLLEEAGFKHVAVEDLTGDTPPRLKLFCMIACIPIFLVKLFHSKLTL